jgi:membrane protein involved in colicin uptake
MMTVSELADRFERLRAKCADTPPEPLTAHEEAIVASALSTLAGLLGGVAWRIEEAAKAARAQEEREAAAAKAKADQEAAAAKAKAEQAAAKADATEPAPPVEPQG